jgi:O-acetyl-ADP-ribose deacetylase (regulator of RNase III)
MTIVRGDITRLDVEAIVNAANTGLLGGGGVDGAIHRAAGPELLAACRALPEVAPGVRCPTGEARITPAFRLKARFVIHTAGPVWHGGGRHERELLASCYRSSLALARDHRIESIAFPAISCGIYGFPVDEAAQIAVREIRAALLDGPQPSSVRSSPSVTMCIPPYVTRRRPDRRLSPPSG